MVTTTTRNGSTTTRRHLFLTSIGTAPEALLRLIRQRWSIENEWRWSRDAQLGEDALRYANRTGEPVFSFLRTVVMNLLRRSGYRSIRQGPEGARLRHQGNAGAGRRGNGWSHELTKH